MKKCLSVLFVLLLASGAGPPQTPQGKPADESGGQGWFSAAFTSITGKVTATAFGQNQKSSPGLPSAADLKKTKGRPVVASPGADTLANTRDQKDGSYQMAQANISPGGNTYGGELVPGEYGACEDDDRKKCLKNKKTFSDTSVYFRENGTGTLYNGQTSDDISWKYVNGKPGHIIATVTSNKPFNPKLSMAEQSVGLYKKGHKIEGTVISRDLVFFDGNYYLFKK